MKQCLVRYHFISLCFFLLTGCSVNENTGVKETAYPLESGRILSGGHTTYYIDPNTGNDENRGSKKDEPWKSFRRVNQMVLTKGDRIEVMSPGAFHESLFLIGQGTAKLPVTIHFAPGRYHFFPEHAFKAKFQISNTNDTPDSLKTVAFYFLGSKHVQVKATGAEMIFRGKVMETCIDHCENVIIDGIGFDYQRPTVSEMKIVDVQEHFADAFINKDSKFRIKDRTLEWIGEGWQSEAQEYWQIFDPENQTVRRHYLPIKELWFSKINEDRIRVHFNENPGFQTGFIFQTRDVLRDYAAVFMQRSKNLVWKNTHVYFMHGMGFISQYCENVTFDSLCVSPRENSGRTCAAWADILHFSGCKGLVEVKNSYLSASNDDAINIHGTYLRIIELVSDHQVKVRFIHPQTYGFDAFITGDKIAFVDEKTLLPYAENEVAAVNPISDKEILLRLKMPVSDKITENDVIENITWTPDVNIFHNKITQIPTRGILVTTRGKVRIENNKIIKIRMSGILIADDANSWFESGLVNDVLIKNNLFEECGGPVINIHPENLITDPVHQNISVTDNHFKLVKGLILSAKSTENISFTNNFIELRKAETDDLTSFEGCRKFKTENNKIQK